MNRQQWYLLYIIAGTLFIAWMLVIVTELMSHVNTHGWAW